MTLHAQRGVCAVSEVLREVPVVELRILGGLNLLGAGGHELKSVLAQALDLYRGDLLEGFFIRGAPAFEQWLEDERARLRAVALRSATLLAERSDVSGALAESGQWARRALRIAPLDEPAFRRLIRT